MTDSDPHPTSPTATTPAPTCTTTACASCGGPTAAPPPLSWPDTSPPPAYRPIRFPAINAPTQTSSIILTPVPQPLPVPTVPNPSTHPFVVPTKQISSPADISRFHSLPAGRHFLGFIAALSHSARGLKISSPLPSPSSSAIPSLLSLLSSLSDSADRIPPLPHSSRYGNPAFRTWHDHLSSSLPSLLLPLLPDDLRPALPELSPYLLDSFGNPFRIDYGTGHETNFAAFLFCLARLGLVQEPDYPSLVLRVFTSYLDLMRKLQLRYSLEPAGSHGVWGLDDYHFLPYVFGSAQLVDHKYMKPKSIHNDDILENFEKDYMYLSCVAFVKKVKKGPFAEHSPMLDDISGVPTWAKVNSGLLKMYKAEVLEKVPIMQHFLFGSLIKWE
ncbi:putative serine/threonine-protein phosphatase 2A activator [Iris pallida]|uniref:Serine/threonine-protein phosphatase 2A activator n=1 Tax=Iris pallida TaxID=29817 RepID=A0AAX6DJ81_IRIPA|nr:putative serine/threonine-protein phosphatase 2A activator [Iris pallida]